MERIHDAFSGATGHRHTITLILATLAIAIGATSEILIASVNKAMVFVTMGAVVTVVTMMSMSMMSMSMMSMVKIGVSLDATLISEVGLVRTDGLCCNKWSQFTGGRVKLADGRVRV